MKKFVLPLLIFLSICGFSQVKIGSPGAPNSNAVLELDGGTSKGFLLPRLNNSTFGNMSSPPNGMMFFNTDDGLVYIRKNGFWIPLLDQNNLPTPFTLPYEGTSSVGFNQSIFRVNSSTGDGTAIYGNGANGYGIFGKSFTGVGGYFTTTALGKAALVTGVGNVGIANENPKSPLSFDNSLGNKIDFFYSSDAARYGIGVQGSTLQLYSDLPASKTSIGYGNSSSFIETFRIENNGATTITNPASLATGVVTASYFRAANNTFTGGIKTIGTGTNTARMGFFTYAGAGSTSLREYMSITDEGTIYMGQNITDFNKGAGYKLRVQGKIIAEELRVQLTSTWPDYVFAKDYKLPSLQSLEQYIAKNQHLPNVPAADEVQKSGIALGEMQTKMMEKIEELTLYILELNKKNEAITKQMEALQKELIALKKN